MSDLEDSTVTYTTVSSPFEDGSDIGSPGVDGQPIMPEDPYAYIMAAYQVPPSPDYIPGPEEPQSPPPLDFPLPAVASPTTDSPGYVPESDPEEEQKEDDEDPEEDPADYPTDRDDADDEDEDEDEDKEEEEEHPAPADSVPLLLSSDHKTNMPEITLPPRKRLGIDLGPRYEIGESSAAATTRPIGRHRADYGFFGTIDTEIRRRRAEEVGYGIRDV
ncbi:hypothetical protein Tco_1443665 [Tanacetum coccineum]